MTQFNFTHNFSYDYDLAQVWLNDFMNNEDSKQVVIHGDNDYMIVFANETIMNAPYYKISHLRKMSKQALYDILEGVYGSIAQSHYITEIKKEDLIEELIEITNDDYFREHFDQVSWHDLESDFIARGHRQGDAIAVKLISDKKNKFEYAIDCDNIENIFFNTPISASVDIYQDDDFISTIHFGEYINDCYDFDKDEIENIVDEKFSNETYYKALKLYVENNFDDKPKS